MSAPSMTKALQYNTVLIILNMGGNSFRDVLRLDVEEQGRTQPERRVVQLEVQGVRLHAHDSAGQAVQFRQGCRDDGHPVAAGDVHVTSLSGSLAVSSGVRRSGRGIEMVPLTLPISQQFGQQSNRWPSF
jgi:hypothetical protein